ncbi:MAG TPA: hypothetical protein VFH71_02735 [Rhodanobacteraceae bacterium]|jgi:hypothetical protein|nr:hypothetical protein [Rhodanobacteraceae bacterium]
MPLRLVDDDLDLSVDIPVAWDIKEALGIQMQRCLSASTNSPFEWRLLTSLNSILDADLQPPTPKQVSYAMGIAKALAISLPGEALRYRGAMSQFLGRHAPAYQEMCRNKQA